VPRRKLRLHPEAHGDLIEARDWYVARSLIAAERFLTEAEEALDLIQEAPERWPIYRLGARRYVLPTYPYSIVYRVMPEAIEVYAVAHAKRRPTYWTRRRFT